MSFQLSYESSNVLFLGVIVERKENKIREDKENSEKYPQAHKSFQSFKFDLNRIKGKVEAEEEERKKADKVSGRNEMIDVK